MNFSKIYSAFIIDIHTYIIIHVMFIHTNIDIEITSNAVRAPRYTQSKIIND